MRRLLDLVERERQPSRLVASDADPAVLVDIVADNGRGALLWRDSPQAWLSDSGDHGDRALWLPAWMADPVTVARPRQAARFVPGFAVSILETIRPEWLKVRLQSHDDSVVTRFLFAWPGPQPYRSLVDLKSSHEDEILLRLKALARLGESAGRPYELRLDANAVTALNGVLNDLHGQRPKAEGLEAAWFGRGRTFVARLTGLLALMAGVDGRGGLPGLIGPHYVNVAAKLWRHYYWPHARAVFDSAGLHGQVRRGARWLCDADADIVSREDIRRRAFSMTVTAVEADQVLNRLERLGFVKPQEVSREGPGRPAIRWRVNPALRTK
jgi:hypothetical protein